MDKQICLLQIRSIDREIRDNAQKVREIVDTCKRAFRLISCANFAGVGSTPSHSLFVVLEYNLKADDGVPSERTRLVDRLKGAFELGSCLISWFNPVE